MFKLSRRQTILRASIIGCLLVAILSIAAHFITNQFKESTAVTPPGGTVTITKKPGTETYHYGSSGDGTYSRWYVVTTMDGMVYDAFCAQASLDDPRGTSKQALELANDVKNGASIKLFIYIWQVENENTIALRNQIYSLMSTGNWSSESNTVKQYLFTHAVISGLYDADYHGLNNSEKGVVQQAMTYLQNAITSNTPAWQEANQRTLYYAVPDDKDDQVVVWIEDTPKGIINIKKCDSEITSSCVAQGKANFDGITFTLYDGTTPVAAQTLANGANTVQFTNLDTSKTYTVQESGSNTFYNLTAQAQSAQPTEAGVTLTFSNDIKKGNITVNKKDKETGTCTTVTDKHSFVGTTFKLVNNSGNYIYYNGSRIENGATVTTKSITSSTDCSLSFTNLPYGDYIVQETAAGSRYALDETPVYISIPTNNNFNVSSDFYNQPIRGDVTFIKRDPANNLPMSNAYFSISSIDENDQIMETHIVVANQNGIVDTRSSFALHSNHTNGYDELYDSSEEPMVFAGYGSWFGKNRSGQSVPVNDSVGALPYGTYIIQELRCDANMFCSGIINEKITFQITTHGEVRKLGNEGVWDNDCAQFSIVTEATDKKDSDHYIETGQEATITDHISYCAKKNYTFTITGTLMDKSTGEPLLINGEKVEQSIEVKPTTDCGTIDMEFPINTTDLEGKDIVVFEKLYYKENLKSTHEDINDANQTIHIVSLGTVATDEKDDDHFIVEGEKTTIKDTVSYCAPKDQPYRIKGVLIDKTTSAPLIINDKTVEQTLDFTPTENCGTVELLFEIEDTTGLAGRAIVAYETLYKLTMDEPAKEEKIISHEDINDDDQTVTVINFGTYAVNEETGNKLFPRDSDIKVKDIIHYCLQPGKEYTIKGVVMDKSTGNGLLVNSAPVESSVTFTPTEACGDTEMYFEFNTTNLGGAHLVVFEDLYYDGELIIEHHDINDDDESFEIDPNAPDTGYAARVSGGTTETTHSGLLVISAIAITPVILFAAGHFFSKKRVTFHR